MNNALKAENEALQKRVQELEEELDKLKYLYNALSYYVKWSKSRLNTDLPTVEPHRKDFEKWSLFNWAWFQREYL